MKVIKDLVHGYIDIDPIQESLINTLHFQRLKDISQLTAQHVYPSATHNRFEHSLGVMFLSREAFRHLKTTMIQNFDVKEESYANILNHLLLASLLHDIGHAPLSHLGEKYYRRQEIKEHIASIIKERALNISSDVFTVGAKHELMSCYIVLENYLDSIQSAFPDVDMELVCRCIVGKKYETDNKWLEDIAIELLNSKTIDTDKLDYLMRDAFMTGISVPNIDIARLFKNITINPNTKTVSFFSQALPVIQNIIDSRDALYLWVYNHHTVVYSDFITEFYIKHLILNHELDHKFSDKMDPDKYFSCEAISTKLVSNSDLYAKLKQPLIMAPANRSNYTLRICPQLFERKFLKPLWKTLYEYKQFLEINLQDATLIRDLERAMCDENYCFRRYVAAELIKRCGLSWGEVFIVPRSNKFYSLDPSSVFHVYLQGNDKTIGQLLPQKDFGDLYKNVAFYVFGLEEKIDDIRIQFIELIKHKLPHKTQIEGQDTKLRWFGIENK